MKIHKAWISINGRATAAALNDRSRLDLEKGEVWLKFPDDVTEAESIALGKQFEVYETVATFANLEGRSNSVLKDTNGITGYGISIDKESLRRAIAWYEEGEGLEPVTYPVKLVEAIDSINQARVLSNGILLTSNNLTGKLIKVRWPVIYDEQIVRTSEPLSSFVAHVVFSEEEGKPIQFIDVVCQPVVGEVRGKSDKIREVHGKFIEAPRFASF